jgi:hypothetical protein
MTKLKEMKALEFNFLIFSQLAPSLAKSHSKSSIFALMLSRKRKPRPTINSLRRLRTRKRPLGDLNS